MALTQFITLALLTDKHYLPAYVGGNEHSIVILTGLQRVVPVKSDTISE